MSEAKSEPVETAESDDFDFADQYAESAEEPTLLPENVAATAVNCAFIGVGGGGGKLAKAFLDLGFRRTLFVNTTAKDFLADVGEDHLVLIPEADGVAKDVELGKRVLQDASAVVEDALRTKLGKVDWLFVCASGGGGTGSSCHALDDVFKRYLASIEAEGKVVYLVSTPTAQEKLNTTIADNASSLVSDVSADPHVVLDNERQLNHLRGKVGVAGLYPAANKMFAKMWAQVLKLATASSEIQVFDGEDLERLLGSPGRILVGSAILEPGPSLGIDLFQACVDASPCPKPAGNSSVGVLLQVLTPEMADDPEVGRHIEAAAAYVGGRTATLLSGIYIRPALPGLVSILVLGGLD